MQLRDMILAEIGSEHRVVSATNGAAVVTFTAPANNMRWLILSTSISANGEPATAVAFTITSAGTAIETLQIPAAAFSPIIVGTSYRGGPGEAVVCTLPALGTGITGTVAVRATQVPIAGIV